MIDTKELRNMVNGAQFESFANSVINALLDRLEAAEKERDALRAKIEAMEKQEPAGIAGSMWAMPGTSGITVAYFGADEVPVGTKLYLAPGAKGE